MQEDIFFNPVIEQKIEGDVVLFINNVNNITVKIPLRVYKILKRALLEGVSKKQLFFTGSFYLVKFLETLFFYDILITLEESRLLESQLLKKSSRLDIEINSIPDKKINEWCLFGAPVDFAMDPPRSPLHGPFMLRALCKNTRFLRDIGDIHLSSVDNIDKFGLKVSYVLSKILAKKNRALMVGGDHSVTYHSIKEHLKKYPDLILVQFDAHSDINDFESKKTPLNHANFITKLVSEFSMERIIQIGVRERKCYYREGYLEDNKIIQISGIQERELDRISDIIKNKNIYITFDMDVFDPVIFPHVTTPLLGGLEFSTVKKIIKLIKSESKHLIGCDIVEFTCGFDAQGNYFNNEAGVLNELVSELTK